MEADELRGALGDFDVEVCDGDFDKLLRLVNAVEEYEFARGCSSVGHAVSRRTDRRKVEDLLNELGVGFEEAGSEGMDEPAGQGVTLRAGVHDKVRGYSHFVTQFVFDQDDRFRHIGVWE